MDIEVKRKRKCEKCDEWSMEVDDYKNEWFCTQCGATIQIN